MTDGTYLRIDGRAAVRFTRHYSQPIDRVWAALTEPAQVPAWFPAAFTFEAVVGGTIRFSGDAYAEDGTGRVLAYEPPHRFAFTWGDNEVHLELVQQGDGCVLTLTDILSAADEAARNAAGWTVCLHELDAVVAGHPGGGPHAPGARAWQPLYDEYVASGMPSGAEVPGSD
jgi:uncharacterized protein YndB with AHSA1/START domain